MKVKILYCLNALFILFLFHPMLCGVVDLVWTMWTGHSLIFSWGNDTPILHIWTIIDVILSVVFLLYFADSGTTPFDY